MTPIPTRERCDLLTHPADINTINAGNVVLELIEKSWHTEHFDHTT
jgi:hypothetical protein